MLPSRWSRNKFEEAITNPWLFVREARRLVRHSFTSVKYRYVRRRAQRYQSKFDDAIDVVKEDWDNLIILDACRYDRFVELNTIDHGKLSQVISAGSATAEYARRSLNGRDLHDLVYVTPNAKVPANTEDGTFHAFIGDIDISPEAVTKAGREAASQFPNKRLVIHYVQPHIPYLGPTAADIRERIHEATSGTYPFRDSSLLRNAEHGLVSEHELKTLYDENIEVVLPHVAQLIDSLDGKTVVTSDHGELLGERYFSLNVYNHHSSCYLPELRTVPWLEIDSDERREITAEPPVTERTLDEESSRERLEALGYLS